MRNMKNEYQAIQNDSDAEGSDGYNLVKVLLNTSVTKLELAVKYLRNNDIAKKGENISLVISVLGSLRDSLDFKQGKEIAENLDKLYAYMTRRLLQANFYNDVAGIEEVIGLLDTIRDGWNQIEGKY